MIVADFRQVLQTHLTWGDVVILSCEYSGHGVDVRSVAAECLVGDEFEKHTLASAQAFPSGIVYVSFDPTVRWSLDGSVTTGTPGPRAEHELIHRQSGGG